MTRFEDVVRLAPGSWWAARAESEMLGIRARDEKWREYVFHAAGFFQRYPGYVSLHRPILYNLNRLTWQDTYDPALQAAAFAIVLPNLRGQLQILEGTRRWIQQLPLRPVDRYRLAQQAAHTCGNGPGVERFLAPFCLAALNEMPDEQALAEAEAFLALFPPARPAARPVHAWLVGKRDPAAGKQLAADDKALRQTMDGELEAVRKALAGKAFDEAIEAMRRWNDRPAWAVEPVWLELSKKELPELDDRRLLTALDLAFRQIGVGTAADYLLKLYMERDFLQAGELLGASSEAARRGMTLYRDDRGRLAFWIDRWVRMVRRDHEIDAQLPAMSIAVEVARAAGMPDLEAAYLYQRGQLAWDIDLDQAKADLRACSRVCPDSPEAPKAAWLLAALEGRQAIVQGLAPRGDDEFRPHPVSAAVPAEVKVPSTGPALTGAVPLLSEPWTPDRLPASRVMALPRTATLGAIEIKSNDRFQGVVSLLDAGGRVLFKAERSWPFWEVMSQDIYWAEPPLRLSFLPVENVAWVRLDVLDHAAPRGAITGVTVTPAEPAAYPLRITARGENVRAYPLMRWQSPWPHGSGPLQLRRSGGHLSVVFYGRRATLHLSGTGTVHWRLNGHAGTHTGDAAPVELPELADDGPHQLFLDTDEHTGGLAFDALEVAEAPATMPPPSADPEPLVEVAGRLSRRELAVVYSRRGTAAEAAIARKLAEACRVYLVSDDAGLNDYPGPYLVVGTPLTNRFARQLPARTMLWRDPSYLNDPHGRIGQTEGFAYVTGETPEAVVAAGERLLGQLDVVPLPAAPLAFFPVDLFDRIYPWQLHPERPAAEALHVRLGRRDRRSAQVGIRVNHRLTKLEVECTPLRHASGATLPAPRLRFVAGYEWIPFFGSLRLPDLLVERLPVPVEAPAATGLWLTVTTAADTPAGTYSGTLTVHANGKPVELPVSVEVLAATLPPSPYCWYSYASVPYWYHAGTDAWRDAFRALVRNEAEHGATMVSIRPAVTWTGKPFQFDFSLVDWQLETADALYREAGLAPPMYQMPWSRLLHLHGTGEDETRFAAELSRRLAAAGRSERFYLKVGDEPHDILAWKKLAEPFRAGGVQVTTAHSTRYDLSPVTGIMNAWCPNYEHDLENAFLHERQKAGDPFWWYICTVPSTRITGQPVDSLPFYWLTAAWRLDGGHNYAALSPPESGPESTDVPFRYDHGLCWRMAFLPDGTLLDSVRREYEAEGIRDAELIRLVREQADLILTPLLPGKYSYSRDIGQWRDARDALYDLAAETPAP